MQHGIATDTYQRIVMGPGAVYIGASQAALLGATKGGNVLEINRVIRDLRPDGALGKVKGFRRRESVEAILTVRLFEVTKGNVVYALAGASESESVITGGEIAAATYISEVSIVAEITGVEASEYASVIVALTNCLVEGPFTLTLPEVGESVLELKFHAHFDPAALTTEPWNITYVHYA